MCPRAEQGCVRHAVLSPSQVRRGEAQGQEGEVRAERPSPAGPACAWGGGRWLLLSGDPSLGLGVRPGFESRVPHLVVESHQPNRKFAMTSGAIVKNQGPCSPLGKDSGLTEVMTVPRSPFAEGIELRTSPPQTRAHPFNAFRALSSLVSQP